MDIVTRDDSSHPSGVEYDHIGRPRFRMAFPHRSAARPELDLGIDLEAKAATKTEVIEDPASILSNTEASRFHITARVRVEDRSLYLSKGEIIAVDSNAIIVTPHICSERQVQLDSPHQYRWMVAVTAPSYVRVFMR